MAASTLRCFGAALLTASLLAAPPALTGLGGTAAAQTQDSTTLDRVSPRQNVAVEDDAVTLGDLFDGVPAAKADTPVLRAPQPGRDRRLSGNILERIAADHGLGWSSTRNGTVTTVRRLSHHVSRDTVIDAIRDALDARGVNADLEIVLNNSRLGLELPTNVPATVRLQEFSYRTSSGRFSARAIAPAEGRQHARVTITGEAVRMIDVPVLARRIARGQRIREDDLTWVRRAASDVRGNHITDADALVGHEARRPLGPGELLRTTAVEEPILVEDDSFVTIKLRTNRMSLTARGRALEDGAMSDTIRVENIQSQRKVSGTVTGPGVVVVEPNSVPTN